MQKEPSSESLPPERKPWLEAIFRIGKWSLKLFIAVVLLSILSSVLIQVPFIQNRVARYITAELSDYLGTRVSLDRVGIALFSSFYLEGFQVQDPECDTLFYARELKASLHTGIINTLRYGPEIDELHIRQAVLTVNRPQGAEINSLQWLLDHFTRPKNPEKKRPVNIRLRRIYLNEVHYKNADDVNGKLSKAYVRQGLIRIKKMDLQAKILDIVQVSLDQPEFHLETNQAHPLVIPTTRVRPPADSLGWTISLSALDLSEGKFSTHNFRNAPTKTSSAEALDFNHLDIDHININLQDLAFSADSLGAQVKQISAQAANGFILKKLAVKEAIFLPNKIALNGLELITPDSRLGDTLSFSFKQYADFADFAAAVRMNIRFNEASVAIRDIMTFAPALEKNAFFKTNQNERLSLQGIVRGRIYDLEGRNLELSIGKGTYLRGNLDLKDINVPDLAYLGLNLQEARTSMPQLQQIIPRFSLPANFNRLGKLQFRGDLIGFLNNGFTILGELRTNLGTADLSVTLQPNGGKEKTKYKGLISLTNFDLGKWTDNPDFGLVSLKADVRNGKSLIPATAQAELAAQFSSFTYKSYEYSNGAFSGSLNRNFFKGNFTIKDENVDLNFSGRLDFTEAIPVFDFEAELRHLDLQAINLSKKDIILSGDMKLNLRNKLIAKAEGTAEISNLHITLDQDETFIVDWLKIESGFHPSGRKKLSLNSDILQADISGTFEVDQIPLIFQQYLNDNHAGFARHLKIKPVAKPIAPADFQFSLTINDSRGFNHLLSPKLGALQQFEMSGSYRDADCRVRLNIQSPQFHFGQIQLTELYVNLEARDCTTDINIGIDQTRLNNKPFFSTPLLIQGLASQDSLDIAVTYVSEGDKALDKLQLNGKLTVDDSTSLSLRFNQSDLTLMNRLWKVREDNLIRFTPKGLSISNLILTYENYRIGIDNNGSRGLRVALYDFDLSIIDHYWNYQPLNFSGPFNLQIWVKDILKMEGITATFLAEKFLINNDDWGVFELEASAPNLKSRLDVVMALVNDSIQSQLFARGFYNIQDISARLSGRRPEEYQKKFWKANIDLSGVPLRVAEYFLPGIVNIGEGNINGTLNIFNQNNAPSIDGLLTVNDGKFTINYLKTSYQFDQAIVKMDDDWLFNASGTRIRDKFGYTADITGGIRHERLKKLSMDAQLQTNRLLAIDTKKGDNAQFYGKAIGKGTARFSGPLDKIDAFITGTVNDSSQLIIPITSTREAQAINYLQFVDKQSEQAANLEAPKFVSPKGMNIEMELTIGREAQMQLVFDEQAGDIIKGTGKGNIRILVPRNGDFQMYGDYTIEEGDYLFTFRNLLNKQFTVQRGGSIKWNGNPYQAIIKLDAEYRGISTSIGGFIADFIVGERPQIIAEAAKSTDVNLILHLAGELFQPQINFDINFPILSGELKNYADNKLRILKQDPNELNRQAFGLLIAGQFLPADLSVQQAPDAIYNTLSEFVSNQLSLLLTDLFSEFIADGRVLSGIDFNVAYSQYRPGDNANNQNLSRGEEFEVRLRQNYFNDRLSVIVGGNLDTGGRIAATSGASGAFLGNDIVIEYALSDDRNLKLRIYQRLQPDIGGRRLKVGAGLSFRKEYESFDDFVQSIRHAGRHRDNVSN
jgi:hypothetical protein